MGQLRRSTVVRCQPERVFAVLTTVERLPEFSSMTVEVRDAPPHPLGVGDRFTQIVRVFGKDIESDWTVVEARSPSMLRVEGSAFGGARATIVERLVPEAGGTRVELEVDYEMPLGILGDAVDAVYLHGKCEEQAEEILDKLRSLCEASN